MDCSCNKWYWLNVPPFCHLPSHLDSRVLINLIISARVGWSGRGLARAPVWQQLPFSSASHLFPEGAGCQLSSAPPSRGSSAVHLQVLLVVNSKKNLRNFFFLIDPFSSDFASYLSALSPWQTPLTVRHRVIRLSMGRKLWPWAQSESIWLSGVSCEPPLNYKDGPWQGFSKGISHHHCVRVSIVSSCFSWCLLWLGLK